MKYNAFLLEMGVSVNLLTG